MKTFYIIISHPNKRNQRREINEKRIAKQQRDVLLEYCRETQQWNNKHEVL